MTPREEEIAPVLRTDPRLILAYILCLLLCTAIGAVSSWGIIWP